MSRALLKLSGSLVHDYATISDDSPSPVGLEFRIRSLNRGVGGEFVGIRHRSIFGSREPGVPREVVAMA